MLSVACRAAAGGGFDATVKLNEAPVPLEAGQRDPGGTSRDGPGAWGSVESHGTGTTKLAERELTGTERQYRAVRYRLHDGERGDGQIDAGHRVEDGEGARARSSAIVGGDNTVPDGARSVARQPADNSDPVGVVADHAGVGAVGQAGHQLGASRGSSRSGARRRIRKRVRAGWWADVGEVAGASNDRAAACNRHLVGHR